MQLYKKTRSVALALATLAVLIFIIGEIHSQGLGTGAKSFIGVGAAQLLAPYFMMAP